MKDDLKNKPVFLSGLWHSRMTSLWMAFREHEDFTCLYAPLQHGMSSITRLWIGSDTSALISMDASPRNVGDKSLYAEYLYHIKNKGIPKFSRKLPDTYFILKGAETFPELKNYIASLLEFASADGKTPIIGFHRMPYRLGWLTHNFDGHIIHINSDPKDIWQKCMEAHAKNHDSTILNWFRILEKNKEMWLGHLGKSLKLRRGMDQYLVNEASYYKNVLEQMSKAEAYGLLYGLWLKSIYEALYHANLIIDTDRLESAAYTADIERTLKQLTGQDIDLSHFDNATLEPTEPNFNYEEVENRLSLEFANYLKQTSPRDALILLKSDLSHLSIKTQKRLAKIRDAFDD